ncbi:uncharacterized protein IL334_001751 [Kwoniella shivajii]|uniref:GP-PDE domain-containing protein n=1 Tax=Kwoniella shivajii TaxID=564305 RepID=A0ABZ1CT55_9TREE|nr:hypothetical protein IL334_001751 [Kwoniella shivajii]
MKRDVRAFVQAIQHPKKGDLVAVAHRGCRFDGVPENSRSSIKKAVQNGSICIEIDIRLTSDNVPILMNNLTIGRVTNIAEYMARNDHYSPFTGRGYSPLVSETPWKGVIENLKLKEEHGEICDQGVLDFKSMLDFIEEEALEIVIMMDFKCKEAITVVYEIMKHRKNASGVPALEWCIWKIYVHMYKYPDELEKESWWQEACAIGKPLYIPAYAAWSTKQLADPLASMKAFSHHPNVMALEIELRAPGGNAQNLLDYATSDECPIESIGFFAGFGDLWKWDDKYIRFDMGEYTAPWNLDEPYSRLVFIVNTPPQNIDDLLTEGDSPDGHDYRSDLALYRQLGYTWTITDYAKEQRNRGLVIR